MSSSSSSSSSEQTIRADVHDCGELGRLVTVHVPSNESLGSLGIEVSKRKPLVVAIVDRSGSMGEWVQRAINGALSL